jgi:membrane protease YdiL (CAAX protease family)
MIWILFLLMWPAALGTATGLLAARKNRNAIAWGIMGALLPLVVAIVLCFAHFLCPSCRNPMSNEEWKARKCPCCGWSAPTG